MHCGYYYFWLTPLNQTVNKNMPPTIPKFIETDALSKLLVGEHQVYLPGAAGFPTPFINAVLDKPESSRDVHFYTSLAPGVDNPLIIEKLDSSAVVSGLFMQASFAEAHHRGQFKMLPMSYSAFAQYIKHKLDFDLTVVQVTPPDQHGICTLGPSVEFAPLAISKSRKVLAVVNPNLPTIQNSLQYSIKQFDYLCNAPNGVPQYQISADAATDAVARNIATLIDDGCTIQTGVGKVPTALSQLLRNHKNLRIYSGLISDGLMHLAQAGALADGTMHIGCAIAGSQQLYDWLPNFEHVQLRGCEETHAPENLLKLQKFIAINSALEVDLFGQCNLEFAAGQAVSGAGGSSDFARAARYTNKGISIVALVSSYKARTLSRIVPKLSPPGIASLGRGDVDIIVTEHGIADLRNLSVNERAKVLINIAEPELRPQLEQQWHSISTGF